MQLENGRNYLKLSVPRKNQIVLPKLDGVIYYDDCVKFSRDIWDENLAGIASHAITNEPFYTGSLKRQNFASGDADFSPTAEMLNLINEKHSERELTMDEVLIYQRFPANNVMSRWPGFIFTTRFLQAMARNASEGRARLLSHDARFPLGSTIMGEVVEEEIRGVAGNYLRTIEYMPINSATENVIDFVQTGIYKYDSVGITLGSAVELVEIEDPENEDIFYAIRVDHDPTEQFPSELDEISFVYQGRLYAVGSKKNSKDGEADDDKHRDLVIAVSKTVEGLSGTSAANSQGESPAERFISSLEDAGQNTDPDAVEGSSEDKTTNNQNQESTMQQFHCTVGSQDVVFNVESAADGQKLRNSLRTELENQLEEQEKNFKAEIADLQSEVEVLREAFAAECVAMKQQMHSGDDEFDRKEQMKYFSGLPAARLKTEHSIIKGDFKQFTYSPSVKNGVRPNGNSQQFNRHQYGDAPKVVVN